MIGQQLERDLEEVDYLGLFQLDFRPGYSTEIALVTFVEDQDVLVFLDFSVDFTYFYCCFDSYII